MLKEKGMENEKLKQFKLRPCMSFLFVFFVKEKELKKQILVS